FMYAKVYTVNLTGGKTNIIDLTSSSASGKWFDTWLRVEDAAGTELASDDDSGGSLNSRIMFTPTSSGQYRVIVTSFSANAPAAASSSTAPAPDRRAQEHTPDPGGTARGGDGVARRGAAPGP